MKKIFIKSNRSAIWISAAVAGALAAGTGIWFYLQGKRAAALSSTAEHAQDYLKRNTKKSKKHKTDVQELAGIVNRKYHGTE